MLSLPSSLSSDPRMYHSISLFHTLNSLHLTSLAKSEAWLNPTLLVGYPCLWAGGSGRRKTLLTPHFSTLITYIVKPERHPAPLVSTHELASYFTEILYSLPTNLPNSLHVQSHPQHSPLLHWMDYLCLNLGPITQEKVDSERLRNMSMWSG